LAVWDSLRLRSGRVPAILAAMNALKRLRQRLSVAVIRLVQLLGPRRVRVLDRSFRINRHVFNPRVFLTSKFFARRLGIGPDDAVLDIGTGSGVLAIVAAASARRVVATDISPEAVRLARRNAEANGVADRVEVLQGDLFEPLRGRRERFDAILFNPPYLEGRPRPGSLLDLALFDPGRALHRRFFAEAADFLAPGGRLMLCSSSLAGPEEVLAVAVAAGWTPSLVASKRAWGETLFLYRLEPCTAANPKPARAMR